MRIGIITGEYPPMEGGVGAYTRELAAALVAQGHPVYILTDIRAAGRSEPHIHVTAAVRRWNWAAFTVRRWAAQNALDVVNIQMQAAAYTMHGLPYWLPDLLGHLPTVTTFHDLMVPYLFPKAGPLRWQVVLRMARAGAAAVVTNTADELRLRAAGGVRRLAHIPIGSNIPVEPPPGYDRAAWRAALDLPSDSTLCAYFGFMNASKGVGTLFRAFACALQTRPDLYLLMIGGRVGTSDPTNTAYADEIDGLAAQLGIADRLRWTGFVERQQVSGHLLAADFIALPYADGVSFRRGSFMAGLAHGCPIITTQPSVALPELADGENVRLVPPEDPESLAAAMLELARNPALRERLGNGARALAPEFGWDRIAARLIDVFKGVTHE
jgi:glycosyltransferase involved in cell wall biosynthesis